MDVLLQASTSRFKVIRKAFARTMTISDVPGENVND